MIALLFLLQAAAHAPAVVPKSPGEIVAQAPAADWIDIAPEDLLVMQLAPDAKDHDRRVVIQLVPPPFSQSWIANIRTLAKAHWWDGTSINRVQDNYVVQWGDATEKKPLPAGLNSTSQTGYSVDQIDIQLALFGESRTPEAEKDWKEALDAASGPPPDEKLTPDILSTQTPAAHAGWHQRDSYASFVQFFKGWPIGGTGAKSKAIFWPVHCYGMVGVGRDMPPNAGNGTELYTVIGQAPRHLDRNIALVGRVVEGIENLSSLPRGTGNLGFYEKLEDRVPIVSIRLASDLPEAERPHLQYLSTESASFAAYADARANRRDAFFIVPAGGVDICNVPVPIRKHP